MARRVTIAVDTHQVRRIALRAALLDGGLLPPTMTSVVAVARHFGGIQIDPTRTVERTQYLVLWSRLGNYDRAIVDAAFADRRVFEYDAFIVPVERLPELRYVGKVWLTGSGDWRQRARDFIAANAEFRQSILDQLRDEGPLQSRQFDDSRVKVSWQSDRLDARQEHDANARVHERPPRRRGCRQSRPGAAVGPARKGDPSWRTA